MQNKKYHSSVTAMLQNLGWCTLEERRVDARLCLFYTRLFMALEQYSCLTITSLYPTITQSITLLPLHDLQADSSKDFYKYLFYPLAIVQWNALPEYVVCIPSLVIRSYFIHFIILLLLVFVSDYFSVCLLLDACYLPRNSAKARGSIWRL